MVHADRTEGRLTWPRTREPLKPVESAHRAHHTPGHESGSSSVAHAAPPSGGRARPAVPRDSAVEPGMANVPNILAGVSRIRALIWSMEFMHNTGICGLDFRPHHVFSTSVGVVLKKRIDTEISGMMIRNDSRESVRFLLYCAPEVIQGVEDDKTALKYSDIWGFGCLSLYILSEQDPQYYVTDTQGERRLLNAHKNPVTSITLLVGSGDTCPEYSQYCEGDSLLEEFFSGCFQLSPEERIIRVPEKISDKEAYLSGATSEKESLQLANQSLKKHAKLTDPLLTAENGLYESLDHSSFTHTLYYLDEAEHGRDTFVLSIDGENHRFQKFKVLNHNVILARELNEKDSSGQHQQKEVVVKNLEYELPTSGAKRLEAIAILKKSWKMMCKLNHPNILPCIYAILNEETFTERFLTGTQIMDFSPIGDLQQYLTRTPIFPKQWTQHFSYQLLCGIDYMHSQLSIIHGDIKPRNVMVFSDATMKYNVRLKITGLDHSAALAAPAARTKDGKTVVGVRRYMSPEMILQERVGRGTDIWSFGCVVLDMLTGKESFSFAYRETGFSDPFDPTMNSKPFVIIPETDYRFATGHAVPHIPSSITDPDCQQFLKECLTVDVQNRAEAATLLSHLWIAHEIPEGEKNQACVILLQRQESLQNEPSDYPETERQWIQGIYCARMLFTHLLLSNYDQSTFESLSRSLQEQLRTQPLSADQQQMCVEIMENKMSSLPESERGAMQITKMALQNDSSARDMVRQFFPVVLSTKILADFMNDYCRSIGSQHSITVRTQVVWGDVKRELDRHNPIICQIATNETDQPDDILNRAKMVWLAHICPLHLIELEFVIVNGYRETARGETVVHLTRAGGQEVTKTLSDFQVVWNWKASDSLMQNYLMLEEVFPASALFLS